MTAGQRATDYLAREEIRELRTRQPWRAVWLIVHCWGVIFATWAVCAVWTNPLTILLGVLVVGTRQLGLGILMHDAAHHLLFRNHKLNDWVAEWLLNRPLLGGGVQPYRDYHLTHHRHTQQPDDPDLPLSAPFPITRSSFRRKMLRDLTGRTGWKQRSAQVRAAFGPPEASPGRRLANGLTRLGPGLAINGAFLAVLTTAGAWYLYLLLWVVPALTWEPFVARIRNIGEHAAVSDDDDRLRNTRTTLAGWLERAFVAPYWVNYHLEHHLLVSVPCYKLPRMHRLLLEKGLGERMEIEPSYPAMLARATSRPEPQTS